MSQLKDHAIHQKPSASTLTLPWWQQRGFTIGVALLGLLLILIIMTVNITKYESHLATGDKVLLALAPVDPRGFMQGDYMALSYALERDIFKALQSKTHHSSPNDVASDAADAESDFRTYEPSDGYVIVKVDSNNVGHFVRLAEHNQRDDRDTLAADELAIHYRARSGSIKLATNAFFFQEGHAQAFEAAEYGLFRVNDKGEPLLTDMVNSDFKIIIGKISQEGNEPRG